MSEVSFQALPPLTALRSFEAAARHGSFSRAADELCVTHGAVSRQVKLLEDWAGLALFDRVGRRVVLTGAGRRFADRVSSAFGDIAAAARVLRANTNTTRVLTLNILPTFAMRWLLPRLSKFQFTHPQIELRLVTSDQPLERIAPGHFDIAVRRKSALATQEFRTGIIFTEDELPVCSPAFAEANPIRKPTDLKPLPLLVADTREGSWDRWFAAAGERGVSDDTALRRFDHFYLALQAATDGLGFALGPLPLIEEDLAQGRLVAPLSEPKLSAVPYCWAVRSSGAEDPAVTQFVAWLEDEAQDFRRSQ
jgi:LysR family glycine cleavage system transcriptional activator|tara:strand:- start:373 stop:1296 length:924 start_codon:yes stop_codon:yes gene_type:complete